MKDAEIWLILANGLAAQGEYPEKIANEADDLLAEYKKRFDPDYFEAGNDE